MNKYISKPGDADYIVPGSSEYGRVIGCSEVADILGYGYRSALELWKQKTNRAPKQAHKLIFDRGHDMEPIMSRRMRKEYGRVLVAEQVQYRDPERPWLIYHADGMFPKWSPLNEDAVPRIGPGIWEAKAPGSHMAMKMKNEGMTQNYVCQGQIGMHVAQAALGQPVMWGTYGFLDYDSYELVAFDCAASQTFQNGALAKIEAFYQCIINDIPPEDGGEPQIEVPVVDGCFEVITEGEAYDLAKQKIFIEANMKPVEERLEAVKERLKLLLEGYTSVSMPGVGKVSYGYSKPGEKINGEGLLVYCEQLMKNYNAAIDEAMATRNPTLRPLVKLEFRRSDWVEPKAPTRTFRLTPEKGKK